MAVAPPRWPSLPSSRTGTGTGNASRTTCQSASVMSDGYLRTLFGR
ncbi:hypothetical protein QQY66_27030 [Streptomyces sp. DG2A-72]|nr:hypothetical protein [Streptomyces sp. DG2A-72]MDO0935145.1 hypothetical protein [Streptomyces sp. DG2A-72]